MLKPWSGLRCGGAPLHLLLALSLAAAAVVAASAAAKQEMAAGDEVVAAARIAAPAVAPPIRRLLQLPLGTPVATNPALLTLAAGGQQQQEQQQEGSAGLARSLSEWVGGNSTALMACRLQGVSPYYSIHTAALSLELHPEACGRCIVLRCTSAALCGSVQRSVTAAVVDDCGPGCGPGDVRLNSYAFRELSNMPADPSNSFPISWHFTACEPWGAVYPAAPLPQAPASEPFQPSLASAPSPATAPAPEQAPQGVKQEHGHEEEAGGTWAIQSEPGGGIVQAFEKAQAPVNGLLATLGGGLPAAGANLGVVGSGGFTPEATAAASKPVLEPSIEAPAAEQSPAAVQSAVVLQLSQLVEQSRPETAAPAAEQQGGPAADSAALLPVAASLSALQPPAAEPTAPPTVAAPRAEAVPAGQVEGERAPVPAAVPAMPAVPAVPVMPAGGGQSFSGAARLGSWPVERQSGELACGLSSVASPFQSRYGAIKLDAHSGSVPLCGRCVLATCADDSACPPGAASATFQVLDDCGDCGSNDLLLSPDAIGLMMAGAGKGKGTAALPAKLAVQWRFVECGGGDGAAAIYMRVLPGSGPHYAALTFSNTGLPVAGAAINGQPLAYADNRWVWRGGGARLAPPLTIQLTSSTGQAIFTQVASLTSQPLPGISFPDPLLPPPVAPVAG